MEEKASQLLTMVMELTQMMCKWHLKGMPQVKLGALTIYIQLLQWGFAEKL